MAERFELDMSVAFEQLRSHSLQALFTQTLGWNKTPPQGSTPVQLYQQVCEPIAYRDQITVWQVTLNPEQPFSGSLRQQIYLGLSRLSTTQASTAQESSTQASSTQEPIGKEERTQQKKLPLVIFVNASKTRSLWCHRRQESALYVTGMPITLWHFRLLRLALTSNEHNQNEPDETCLFPRCMANGAEERYQAFADLVGNLCDRITGISNLSDRQAYALLTLRRLILLQSLQQKGWLAQDTWYLQTRFGQALEQGQDLFFKHYLQPLYTGLAMPATERPLSLKKAIGDVPFLGYLFETHRIEQQYSDIDICNQPFEEVLGWLSEQAHSQKLNPWMDRELGYLFEQFSTQQLESETNQTTATIQNVDETARQAVEQSLERFLLTRLQIKNRKHKRPFEQSTLNDVLFQADTKLCKELIQDIFPTLRSLDPACGCGNFLVALHQQLTEIFSILTGYIQQFQDPQLKIWRSGLVGFGEDPTTETPPSLTQALQIRTLKNNIYGVDITPDKTQTAQLQLLLHIIATAQTREHIEPLTDLRFNIMTGNSLIGLITVDEERFDEISHTQAGDILQGNLLQPLAADSYQIILAEKNLALEHYSTRNQMLAEARNIPDYARASLLREEIRKLDTKAQQKLDALLLNHMSQHLGIQYKASQLEGPPQRQQLTIEDIDILQPFHWGYHFSKIVQQGGFDVVVCEPPKGVFKPTTEEFLRTFQDLTETKNLTKTSLKTSKKALSEGDAEVTQAWLFYQNQYAYVADYFYRSDAYTQQNAMQQGKRVRAQLALERLFVERCTNLVSPQGILVAVLPKAIEKETRAEQLLSSLKTNGQYYKLSSPLGGGTDNNSIVLIWRPEE